MDEFSFREVIVPMPPDGVLPVSMQDIRYENVSDVENHITLFGLKPCKAEDFNAYVGTFFASVRALNELFNNQRQQKFNQSNGDKKQN